MNKIILFLGFLIITNSSKCKQVINGDAVFLFDDLQTQEYRQILNETSTLYFRFCQPVTKCSITISNSFALIINNEGLSNQKHFLDMVITHPLKTYMILQALNIIAIMLRLSLIVFNFQFLNHSLKILSSKPKDLAQPWALFGLLNQFLQAQGLDQKLHLKFDYQTT